MDPLNFAVVTLLLAELPKPSTKAFTPALSPLDLVLQLYATNDTYAMNSWKACPYQKKNNGKMTTMDIL
jgi:hypothetical protein